MFATNPIPCLLEMCHKLSFKHYALHSAVTVDVEPDVNNGPDTGTKAASSTTGWCNFSIFTVVTHIGNSRRPCDYASIYGWLH